MHPCKKCLENSWEFRHEEGWIYATCKICGYEVSFESKKKGGAPKKPRRELTDSQKQANIKKSLELGRRALEEEKRDKPLALHEFLRRVEDL